MTVDLSQYADDSPKPTNAALRGVEELATEFLVTKAAIERLEGELEAAKKRHADVRDHDLPDALMALGIEGLPINGMVISTKRDVYGSLPKDPARRATAIAILERLNQGGLIKRKLVANFGRDQTEDVKALEALIVERFPEMPVSIDLDVHAQTLCKFAREMMEEGKGIPLEELGLTPVTRAAVKVKK